MKRVSNQLILLCLLCLMAFGSAIAQPAKLGSEILVNTATSGDQIESSVAYSSTNDEYIVVWSGNQSGDYDIFGQRFNSDGVAQGGIQTINTTTANDQTQPDVAVDAAGNIWVTWTSDNGTDLDVMVRKFSNTWANLVAETGVTGNDAFGQQEPSIAILDADAAVVVYSSVASGTVTDIDIEIFSSAGASTFTGLANSSTTEEYRRPEVASELTTGNFAVAFVDSTNDDVYYNLFDNAGATQVAGQQTLGTTTTASVLNVAMHTDGTFAIAWMNTDLRSQTFSNAGVTVAGPSTVSTTAPDGASMELIYLSADSLAYVWTGGSEVRYQEASASALALLGTEMIVNTQSSAALNTDIALGPDNQSMVVWANNPGGTNDIYSQFLCGRPAAPATTGNSGCTGSPVFLTASGAPAGGTYRWYDMATGGTLQGTGSVYLISSLGGSNETYYAASVDADGCESATRTAAVATVIAAPSATTITPDPAGPYCIGDTFALEVPAQAGVTYTWTVPAGFTIRGGAGTDSLSVEATTDAGGNFSVDLTNSCGTQSDDQVITMTPDADDAGAIFGSTSVCDGDNITYSVGVVDGATNYQWVYDGAIIQSSASNSVSIDFTGESSANLSVLPQSGTCADGDSTIQAITVNSLPANAGGFTTSSANVCPSTNNVAYEIAAVSGATSYTWTTPSGATVDAPGNTNSVTIDFGAGALSGGITVTPENSCGSGGSANMTVTVDAAPTVTVTGGGTICQGDSSLVILTFTGGSPWDYDFDGVSYTGETDNPKQIYVKPLSSTTLNVTSFTNGGSCGSSVNGSAVFTVNDSSTVTQTLATSGSICEGATKTLNYGISGGNTANWSVTVFDGTSNEVISGLSGSTDSHVFSPDATTTYTLISATNGDGCTSTLSDADVVTVDPLPGDAGAFSTFSTNVCAVAASNNIEFEIAAVANATTYNWSFPTGVTISSGTGTRNVFLDFSGATDSGYVVVQPQNSCGVGDTSGILVDVGQQASVTAGGTQTICNGDSALVTLSFTGEAPFNYTFDATNYTNVTANPAIHYVSPTSTSAFNASSLIDQEGCGAVYGSAVTITVTDVPASAPASLISQPASICKSSAGYGFTSATVGGATGYAWSFPTGFTITANSTLVNPTVSTGSDAVSGNVEIRATNSCGAGPALSVPLTVTPDAGTAGSIVGSTTVCEAETENYSIDAVTGADTYRWVYDGVTLQTSASTSVAVDYTGLTSENLSVLPLSSTCADGDSSIQAIVVNARPTANFDPGTLGICAGQSTTLRVDLTSGNSTNWQYTFETDGTPQTISSVNQDPDTITVTPAANTTYELTEVVDGNGCVASSLGTPVQNVVVTPLPSAAGAFSAAPTPLCQDTTNIVYTIPASANATSYSWTVPSGATVDAPGNTASVTVDFSGSAVSGDITVTPVNGCGTGTPRTTSITINGNPTATISGDNTICDGDSTLLTVNLTGATDFDFEINGTTYTNESSPFSVYVTPAVGATIYTVADITDNNGCETAAGIGSATVNVNALPDPSFTIAAGKANFDITEDSTQLIPANSGGFAGNGLTVSGGNTYFNPSVAGVGTHPVTHTYTDANGCTDAQTQPITVTSSGLNIVSLTGRGNTYCYRHEDNDTLRASQSGGAWEIDGNAPSGTNGLITTPNDSIIILSFTDVDATANHQIKYTVSSVEAFYSFAVDSIPADLDFTFFANDSTYCESVTDAVQLTSQNNPSGGSGTFFALNAALAPAVTDLGLNGLLRPNQATAGGVTDFIYYEYTSNNGCKDTVVHTAVIYALPTVTFTIDEIYNITEDPFVMNGTPTSGDYTEISGTNIPFDTLDPVDLGLGQSIITYEYTDGNGCTNSVVDTTTIVDGTAEITGIDDFYCYDGPADTLNGEPDPFNSNGYNGRFTSYVGLTPITSTDSSHVILDVTAFGPGKHAISFIYEGLNNAEITITDTLLVDSIGTYTFTGLNAQYCEDEGQQTLTAGVVTPTGGTYEWTSTTDLFPSITNQQEAFLFPSISGAKASNDTVRVTYTSPIGCTSTVSQAVKIDTIPTVSFSIKSVFNVSEAAVTLVGSPAGVGGTFSYLAAPITEFDPADFGVGGPYDIDFDYVDGNGCTNSTTEQTSVVVGGGSVAGLTAGAIYCYDQDLDTLVGVPDALNNDGTPGSWTPAAVFTTVGTDTAIFDHRAFFTAGYDTIKYIFNDVGGDPVEVPVAITVDSIGQVSFSGIDTTNYCSNDNDLSLSSDVSGILSTGTVDYTGPEGILPTSNGSAVLILDRMPTGVQNIINYEYTRTATGCTAATSDTVIIDSVAVPDFTISNLYSLEDDSVDLAETPPLASGGVFSGQGITSGNYFDPAKAGVGTHSITYQFTDMVTGCVAVNVQSTTVNQDQAFIVSAANGTFGSQKIYCITEANDTLTGVPDPLNNNGNPGRWEPNIFSTVGGKDSIIVFDLSDYMNNGADSLKYIYENNVGTEVTVAVNVIVDSIGPVTFSGLDTTHYCSNANQISITSDRTGFLDSGTVAYSGFIGILPTDAGNAALIPGLMDVNTQLILNYTYTRTFSGCRSSITDTLQVDSVAVPSFSLNANYGVQDDSVALNPTPPTGGGDGVFIGSGITYSEYFDPGVAGVGAHTITYQYTDPVTGCSSTDTRATFVNDDLGTFTSLAGEADAIYCYGDARDTIYVSAVNDVPGTGSLDLSMCPGCVAIGGNDSTFYFDPNSAGTSANEVVFNYQDINTDPFELRLTLNVDSVGTIDFTGIVSSYCIDDGQIFMEAVDTTLTHTLDPGVSGSSSFTSASNGLFDANTVALMDVENAGVTAPGVPHEVTLTYTAPTSLCTATATDTFVVYDLPNVSILTTKTIYNVTEGIASISAAPGPGVWLSQSAGISGTDSTFNPELAGLGLHEIVYTYVDSSGTTCANSDTIVFDVQDAQGSIVGIDSGSLGSFPNLYCYDAPVDTIYGVSTGGDGSPGSFTGRGIVDLGNDTALYYPSLGYGATPDTVIYTYQNGAVTFNIAEIITIDSLASVEFYVDGIRHDEEIAYCSDADAAQLLAITIPGGASNSFSGPALGFAQTSDGKKAFINPQVVIPDSTYEITFTHTAENGCQSDTVGSVRINSLPVVSFVIEDIYNLFGLQDTLEPVLSPDTLRENGQFFGNGIVGDIFFPSIADTGYHDIVYQYTDLNGCVNSDTIETFVTTANAVIFGLPDLRENDYNVACYDSGAVTIWGQSFNGGLPGSFSGDGIINLSPDTAIFDPALAGEGEAFITYSYLDTAGTSFSVDTTIYVDSLPTITFVGLLSQYCIDADSVQLTGSPGPGYFTGPGMLDSVGVYFYAARADTGDITITYTHTSDFGCIGTASNNTRVDELPQPYFDLDSLFCSNSVGDTIIGLPAGGNFEGPGLINIGGDDTVRFAPSVDLVGTDNITYEVTSGAGCTNTFTRAVTVFAEPEIEIEGLEDSYCVDDPVDTLIVFNHGLLASVNDTGTAIGPGILPNDTAVVPAYFDPSVAGVALSHVINVNYIDTNNCTDQESISITVNGLPSVGLTGLTEDVYCSDDDEISLSGFPTVENSLDVRIIVNDSTTLQDNRTIVLSEAEHRDTTLYVTYQFTDLNGCVNSITDTAIVNPSPEPNFGILDKCIEFPIAFQDSTVSTDPIVSYSWDFDDDIVNPGADTSTEMNPSYVYTVDGFRTIRLDVVTDQGCTAFDTLTDEFGRPPVASFNWTNDCFIQGESVNFNNLSTGIVVDNYFWNFGDLATDADTSILENPSYQYDTAQAYIVSLTVNTTFGCSDTRVDTVSVRPFITTFPYDESFETSEGGWVSEFLNSDSTNSWAFGVPAGGTIVGDTTNHAWVTNLTGNHDDEEQSAVVGPCFDMTQLSRPMIKMKIWTETEENDGAVLEYSSLTDPDNWIKLGTIDDGSINWYNSNTIASEPGATPDRIGWSGSTGGWIEIRHELDALLDDAGFDATSARFRVAFGSNAAVSTDGVAFDDIWIGERPRMMLVEHFTNAGITRDANGASLDMEALDDDIYNLLVDNDDVVHINYHTRADADMLSSSNPEDDPIYTQYSLAPDARALYYSLTPPATVLDGNILQDETSAFITNSLALKTQALTDPLFDLTVQSNIADNELTVDVTAISDTTIPDPITLRVAIIERNVTLLDPVNGRTQFRNVVRKMLSVTQGVDAPGTIMDPVAYDTTNAGAEGTYESMVYFMDDYVSRDPDDLQVVAWVQNTTDDRSIYQVAVDDTTEPATAIYPELYEELEEKVSIYPNPTENLAYIMVPEAWGNELNYSILDNLGVSVASGTFPYGEHIVGMITADLPSGVYQVLVSSNEGEHIGAVNLVVTH